jgi:hypothetical protein
LSRIGLFHFSYCNRQLDLFVQFEPAPALASFVYLCCFFTRMQLQSMQRTKLPIDAVYWLLSPGLIWSAPPSAGLHAKTASPNCLIFTDTCFHRDCSIAYDEIGFAVTSN